MAHKKNYIETIDRDKIILFIENKSSFMYNYITDHIDSEYYMVSKYISHSDLTNKGKRNGNQESIEKNFLYYLSDEEMRELEQKQENNFETAKQSNIGLPTDFYAALGMPQLQRRKGQQTTQHEHLRLNDYGHIYLVNDSLNYFSYDYTQQVFLKLNKHPKWSPEDQSLLIKEGELTPIQVSHAIHGIGTSKDVEFSKLRGNIFKNDILTIIVESRPDFSKNVFILLEKNPIFFTIIGESNKSWQEYSEKLRRIEENQLKLKTIIDIEEEEKTRKNQAKWRQMIAEEMMNYSTTEGEVVCPFTYLRCDFNELGTIFRASHIKSFSECEDIREAYDINNGLLLCANADALFDKHLITVNENKELLISFLLQKNPLLVNNLLLNQPIFKSVLNEERMRYMKRHRKIFFDKEIERKKG